MRDPRRLVWGAALLLLVALGAALPTAGATFSAGTATGTNHLSSASSYYAQTVLDDDPVGYWRLGENGSTDVAADSSGGNHPGRYYDTPTLGRPGTSHDADTAMQGGSVGYGVMPRLVSADFTLECWFKTAATSSTIAVDFQYAPFMLFGNDYGYYSMTSLAVGLNGDGRIMAGTRSMYTTVQSTGSFNDDAWHHLAFTRKQTGEFAVFVDGTQVISGVGGAGLYDSAANFGVGANVLEGHHAMGVFDGSIDEVAQYPVALSQARIQAHVAARTTGYVTAVMTDGPVGYWRLADTSGRMAAAVGGPAADGGMGGDVQRGVAGAIPGDPAMLFTHSEPSSSTSVPRLVSGDFTIEARFRSTQLAGSTGAWYTANRIFGSDVPQAAADFGIGLGSDGRIYAGVGSPDTDVDSPAGTRFNDGAWHDVALTRKQSTGELNLYADGVLVDTRTGPTITLDTAAVLNIGADYAGRRYNEFAGTISDVAQYPAVLGAAQLAAHHSAAAHRTAVLADAPSGYWPLDETSGSTLSSLTGGPANDGRLSTDATLTGSGIAFTATNQQGALVPRLVQDDFTLECWFRTGSGNGGGSWYNDMPLIQGDFPGGANDFGLALSPDGRVVFGGRDGPDVVRSAAGTNDGQWHHVVLTRNATNGTALLYVDGVLAGTGTGTGPTGSLDAADVLGLGMNWIDDAQTLAGVLDEVAVYPRILTPAQVAYHYARGSH